MNRSNYLQKRERAASGFTMIEMVIALVILFIAVMGVFAAVTWATRYNRGNSQRSQALAVMQREIEYLRAAKFTPTQLSTFHTAQTTPPTCPNLTLGAGPTPTPLPDDGRRSLTHYGTGATEFIDFRCGIDGTLYRVNVVIDDDPSTPVTATSTPDVYPWPRPTPPTTQIALMKQISVEVTPMGAEGGWVTANAVRMTFRRVLAN